MDVFMCSHECRYPQRPDALELELQVIVNYLMWVIGLNSGPLEKHGVIFCL